MKSIKFILATLIAVCAIFSPAIFGESGSYLALGIMVTPDIKRGYLALFVDYIKKMYPHLSHISEMDLRSYNVRLLQDMKNSVNQYNFDPRFGYKGSNGDLPQYELLLDDKKLFFASEIRVATRKIDAVKQLGAVFTYEDVLHHDDTDEVNNLLSLYNGRTTIITDNVQRVTKLSNDVFRVVPNRVKGEATDVLTAWPQYGPTTQDKGYFALAPTPVLDSSKSNSIMVDLVGVTSAIAGAANKKNILQVDLLGWVFDPQSSGGGLTCGF